jgi:hypothetical protein
MSIFDRAGASWGDTAGDHLAILFGTTTGACSVADGCGTHRAAEFTLDVSDYIPQNPYDADAQKLREENDRAEGRGPIRPAPKPARDADEFAAPDPYPIDAERLRRSNR